MKKLLFTISVLAILAACSSSTDYTSPLLEEMPDDFDFSLQYGVTSASELNTYEDTYTKDLVSDGTATTDMKLTEDERQFIYEKFRSVDLLALPTERSNSATEPHEKYDLTMTADGEEYSLKWSMLHDTNKLEEWKNAMREIHEEIIFEREEYQELPEASGGYD